MEIVLIAKNSIGRILAGDLIVVETSDSASIGQVVACGLEARLEKYREDLGGLVVGRVLRAYIEPLPKNGMTPHRIQSFPPNTQEDERTILKY